MNIKEKIKDNYKISIPIILILILFVSFAIYFVVSRTSEIINKVEERNLYQYLGNEKVTYNANVTMNMKNVITDIEPIDVSINYDSTPIYDSDDENIIILPSNMSVVAPIMNCVEYMVKANSYIKLENKRYNLITNKFNNALGHYFLYDGDNLYLFIEKVILVVDNKQIELSPYSYLIADKGKITYYDKVNDKYEVINTDSFDNYIYNDYYKIYINGDYIDYFGDKVLLTTDIDKLSTIDMMKRTDE